MTPRWCWKIFGNTACCKRMRAPAPSSRQLKITIKRQLLLFPYCRLVTLFIFLLLILSISSFYSSLFRCHQYCTSHLLFAGLTKTTTIRFDVPVTPFECVTCPLVDSVRADECRHDDSWLWAEACVGAMSTWWIDSLHERKRNHGFRALNKCQRPPGASACLSYSVAGLTKNYSRQLLCSFKQNVKTIAKLRRTKKKKQRKRKEQSS